MRAKARRCKAGMSLPELLISLSIFGFIVAGATSSALLFARTATNHNNRANFNQSTRIGFEQLALDLRNARRITGRTSTGFLLTNWEGDIVQYAFDASNGAVFRTENGQERRVFRNVETFDILVDVSDASKNPELEFDRSQLAIERLRFRAPAGRQTSNLALDNFVFKLRNS